jgi:hypothetical protein
VIKITRQILSNRASKEWDHQYKNCDDEDKIKIGERLRELGEDPNPDDVDRITGNESWTRPGPCDECGADSETLITIGEPEDYESSTASVCIACLRKAIKLAREV